MNIFHKHNWKKIKETYLPPTEGVREMNGIVGDFANRVLFGQTTILWECEDCQKLRKEELYGK